MSDKGRGGQGPVWLRELRKLCKLCKLCMERRSSRSSKVDLKALITLSCKHREAGNHQLGYACTTAMLPFLPHILHQLTHKHIQSQHIFGNLITNRIALLYQDFSIFILKYLCYMKKTKVHLKLSRNDLYLSSQLF